VSITTYYRVKLILWLSEVFGRIADLCNDATRRLTNRAQAILDRETGER